MRHGSLFSGIGGFDLAAEWMGWENAFQVEKDPFCQKVLAKNFPQSFILPSCSKDAGHKRDRVWIVAHLDSPGFNRQCQEIDSAHRRLNALSKPYSIPSTDINGIGVQRELQKEISGEQRTKGRQTQQQFTDAFQRSDAFEPKLCRTLHGIPFGVDRIKALGNAIVPQVAFEIFKAIEKVTPS